VVWYGYSFLESTWERGSTITAHNLDVFVESNDLPTYTGKLTKKKKEMLFKEIGKHLEIDIDEEIKIPNTSGHKFFSRLFKKKHGVSSSSWDEFIGGGGSGEQLHVDYEVVKCDDNAAMFVEPKGGKCSK